MQPADIVRALEASHAALTRGDAALAEQVLQPVLALRPPIAKAEFLLALIRTAQGRRDAAERLMKQALARTPGDYECWNALGGLYLEDAQWDAAIRCFQQASGHNARYAPARMNLVSALLGAERFEDAEREARALLTLGETAQAQMLLGSALRRQSRFEAALSAFDRALTLAPQLAKARHDRAIVLDRMGRGEEAVEEYARLHGAGLKATELFRNWSGALMDLGRLEDAERVFEEAVTLYPLDRVIQDNLARLRWLKSGETNFARDYVSAVNRRPDDLELRVGCADLLRRSGQREEAAAMVREGLARSPSHPALLGALGVVLGEMDELEEAEAKLKQALPALQQDWSFRENLTEVLLRRGKADEALRHVAEARAARPLDQAWIAHYATAMAIKGDPEYERIYDFERMVRPFELPTPPGFASTAEFNAALMETLRKLHQLRAHPIDQSLVGGTQTSKSLLESSDPLILAFFDAIGVAMSEFVASMPDEPAHPFWGRKPASHRCKMVGAWSVRLRRGGYHVNHVHPEGWISCAYYSVMPQEARGSNDHQGWIQFGEPRRPVPGVSAGRFVEPRPGTMAMFPSYMWHGTVPFRSGDERMTIAMDAVPAD